MNIVDKNSHILFKLGKFIIINLSVSDLFGEHIYFDSKIVDSVGKFVFSDINLWRTSIAICEEIIGNDSNIVVKYVYTLGASGERLKVEELDRTVEYTYDSLYRLTSETITKGIFLIQGIMDCTTILKS